MRNAVLLSTACQSLLGLLRQHSQKPTPTCTTPPIPCTKPTIKHHPQPFKQNPYEALQLALDPSNIHPVDVALVNGEVFTNLATAGNCVGCEAGALTEASEL